MLDNLKRLETALADLGLVRTESIISSLVERIQNPNVPKNLIIEDFDIAPTSLMMEMSSRYPLHYSSIKGLSIEFEKVTKRKSVKEPLKVWDSLEDRGALEHLGNIIVDRINKEQDPVVRTLLLCLNILALYETGKANFGNFINSVLIHYEKAVAQEFDPLLETALTLNPEHTERESGILIRTSIRCEMCRIRNGVSHFRFEIANDGNLHVWDIGYNKMTNIKERIFDHTYPYNKLLSMSNIFYDRLLFLDILAYLITIKAVITGPNASDYLTG